MTSLPRVHARGASGARHMPEPDMFQSQWARALLSDPGSPDVVVPEALRRGFAVHRNNVFKALIDALVDNYPTVERLVGREWFAACAIEYVRAHPPFVPALALYGAEFVEYLSTFAPAEELPYLPEVARIDRLWLETYFARGAPVLAADRLAGMTPEQIFDQRLSLHPTTRFGRADHSAVTIWLRNRPSAPTTASLEVDGTAEGVLMTRPHLAVEPTQIDIAAVSFLGAIQGGATLGVAATVALTENSGADIAAYLAKFIHAGVFADVAADAPKESA